MINGGRTCDTARKTVIRSVITLTPKQDHDLRLEY